MNLTLSYPFESFQCTSDAFRFIIDFISFKPAGILASHVEKEFLEFETEKIVNYLNKYNLDSFNLVEQDSEYFDFKNSVTFRREILKNLNVFIFSLESYDAILLDKLIKSTFKLNFTLMFKFDVFKSKWQSEEIIPNYITFKKPYEHLLKIWDTNLSPIWGEIIDISKNPGHMKETYSIVLMAAPEMWFGPGSWNFFNKELVLSFSDALEIKEMQKDVVYIKLFDPEASDYETTEILDLQKKFRQWVKMDEIEEELNKKVQKPDSSVTLNVDLRDPKQLKEYLKKTDLKK